MVVGLECASGMSVRKNQCRPLRDSFDLSTRTPDLRPGLMNSAASRLEFFQSEANA
jgi:hypothetical protein